MAIFTACRTRRSFQGTSALNFGSPGIRDMVLTAEIDRHPLGREARGEDLHPALLGVALELARQIHDVGLPIQQHGQAGRFFRGDADLQLLELRPDAAPVVLHPLEYNGLAQLTAHIAIRAGTGGGVFVTPPPPLFPPGPVSPSPGPPSARARPRRGGGARS